MQECREDNVRSTKQEDSFMRKGEGDGIDHLESDNAMNFDQLVVQ